MFSIWLGLSGHSLLISNKFSDGMDLTDGVTSLFWRASCLEKCDVQDSREE